MNLESLLESASQRESQQLLASFEYAYS